MLLVTIGTLHFGLKLFYVFCRSVFFSAPCMRAWQVLADQVQLFSDDLIFADVTPCCHWVVIWRTSANQLQLCHRYPLTWPVQQDLSYTVWKNAHCLGS